LPSLGASVDSRVLHEEIDKLLVDERMKWQKMIVDSKNGINRCDFWDGDRRAC
jgi:hypothetical protein